MAVIVRTRGRWVSLHSGPSQALSLRTHTAHILSKLSSSLGSRDQEPLTELARSLPQFLHLYNGNGEVLRRHRVLGSSWCLGS